MVTYVIKIIFLMLLLGHVSYFFGLMFLKFIDIEEYIVTHNYSGMTMRDAEFNETEYNDTILYLEKETMMKFVMDYEGEDSSFKVLIKMTYFAFTTLTTTGFGDISPLSAAERLFGSMMLLGGVAMFSYIMGIFQGILAEYTAYDQDLQDEEGYHLIMFL